MLRATLVTALLAAPAVARAGEIPLPTAPTQPYSLGVWGAGGNGQGAGAELTYSYTYFGPHLSLGGAALHTSSGTAADLYADAGAWFLVSVAAGAGYCLGPSGTSGAEMHLFLGLPIPIGVTVGVENFVLEPIVRLTHVYARPGENIAELGVQLRFSFEKNPPREAEPRPKPAPQPVKRDTDLRDL